jgi:hypothetical protein
MLTMQRIAFTASIALAVMSVVACSSRRGTRTGGGDGDGGGEGGDKTTVSSSSTLSGMGGGGPGAGGAGNGGGPGVCESGGLTGACAPTGAKCEMVQSRCIALDDPCGKGFSTHRISQLTVTKPTSLSMGLAGSIVTSSVQMNLPDCNLQGNGTFSWLLQFDELNGLMTTGATRPEQSPTSGYCMMDEFLSGILVAPTTTSMSIDKDGVVNAAKIPSLNIPIFLDLAGSSYVLIPMRGVSLHDAKLSPDRRCIGEYNADGLDPANSCAPQPPAVPQFKDAGKIDAYILLEDADDIIISAVNQSLCVLISGDPGLYGNGGSPIQCKRDGLGKIVFKGDWCNATDAAATANCFDSSRFNASFASSAVAVKGGC